MGYKARRPTQEPLRTRLANSRTRELAAARVSYGYLRLHVLLKREGWKVNHKRVYRLLPRGSAGPPETETETPAECDGAI